MKTKPASSRQNISVITEIIDTFDCHDNFAAADVWRRRPAGKDRKRPHKGAKPCR